MGRDKIKIDLIKKTIVGVHKKKNMRGHKNNYSTDGVPQEQTLQKTEPVWLEPEYILDQ